MIKESDVVLEPVDLESGRPSTKLVEQLFLFPFLLLFPSIILIVSVNGFLVMVIVGLCARARACFSLKKANYYGFERIKKALSNSMNSDFLWN